MHLCIYIDDLRKLDILVITSIVIIKAINTIPGFVSKIYIVYHLWAFDLIKRNRYSKRKVTHFQQKLPPDTLEKIYDFIKECLESGIYYQIDENIDLIANVDKTPIWMEFKIENTITKIGEKEIRIKLLILINTNFRFLCY